MPESRAARSIREAFQSGRPLTYVHSPEELRVVRILEEVSRGGIDSRPLPLWTWSSTEGHDGAPPIMEHTVCPDNPRELLGAHPSTAAVCNVGMRPRQGK